MTDISEKNFIIREIKPEEMPLILDWAANEGWNPGLHDAHCFYNQDKHGFFIGLLDGEPVCSVSAVKYGAGFGFIGFYIVKPDYRGEKYGAGIAMKAINYLKNFNIGLDGVLERKDNYARLGFKYAYKNYRFEGSTRIMENDKTNLVPADSLPFEQIAQYDRLHFPDNRDIFLKYWLKMPNANSAAYMKNGQIQGYGVIRSCRQGYKIGPLFADNFGIADNIFRELVKFSNGEHFYLDIPEPNERAFDFVSKYELKEVFATARMYSKFTPEIRIKEIFGITSFELG
jgi:hypothetical protein